MEEFISDRIRKLMEAEGLSASAFADQIQVQRSSISHIMSGRNKPSLDFIEKILSAFPDVQAQWLITGTGPMKQLYLFEDKAYQPRTEFSDPILPNPQVKEKVKPELLPYSSELDHPRDTKEDRMNEEKKAVSFPFSNPPIVEAAKSERVEESKKPRPTEASSKKIVQIVLIYDDQSFTLLNPDKPVWEK